MKIGPFEILSSTALQVLRTKAAQALTPLSSRGGWWRIIHEPYTGAWQRNEETLLEDVLAHSAVYACVSLASTDVAKLGCWLVEEDDNGIWHKTESAAFSPVLRKPNRYQSRVKFIEQWLISKLIHGNTYVLKQRDSRRVVTALYVLDPSRVTPLVAADGSVYYELRRDDLSNLPQESVTVPASEIIHDTMVALYHPLVGVSPIYACGTAALQGLAIQNNSKTFFSNGSRPGGVLTAPGAISQETADRLKAYWDTNFTGDNAGKVAVLGDGLTYQGHPMISAHDAQLIEQLGWTGVNVCTCFHVPPYLVDIGPAPPYANSEPLLQKYYSQCLQTLIINLETCLDEGLGLGPQFGNRYGVEFDPDDLIWLDSAARNKAAADGIGSGALSPNEARKKYHAIGPVTGGDSPMVQQQYYSLEALAERDKDKPFSKPAPALPPAPVVDGEVIEDEDDTEIKGRHLSTISGLMAQKRFHAWHLAELRQ